MTNIVGIKTGKGKDKKIFMVSDSMSSMTLEDKLNGNYMNLKNDKAPKLFSSQGFLLAVAGDLDNSYSIANKFYALDKFDLTEVVDLLMNYAEDNLKLELGDGPDFLLAGPNEGELDLALARCTPKEISHNTVYEGEEIETNLDFAPAGSSDGFVYEDFLEKLNLGKIKPQDHVEGFSLIYDAMRAGLKSPEVNDKIQLGVLSKDASAIIYHPDVNLTNSHRKKYWKDFAGIESTINPINQLQGEEFENEMDKAVKINPLFEEFYHAMVADLDSYSRSKNYAISIEKMKKDGLNLDDKQVYIGQLMKERKNNIAKGLDALLSTDVNDKLAYIDDFHKRQKEKYTSLFK